MKKISKDFIITAVICIILVGGVICGFIDGNLNSKGIYKSTIDVDIPKDSEILIKRDAYSGFRSEGEYYEEIQLTEEGSKQFLKSVKEVESWHDFPLSDEVNYLIYGFGTEYIDELLNEKFYEGFPESTIEEREKLNLLNGVHNSELKSNIPYVIKNGMYFLKDRNNIGEDNDKNILLKVGFKYTIAILDLDTKKIYIYELNI